MTKGRVCTADPRGEVILGVPINYTAEVSGYAEKVPEIHLSDTQALTLKRITEGLKRDGAAMDDGRKVLLPRHAVCWLLDKVAGELEVG